MSGHRGRALLSVLGLAAVTFGLYFMGRTPLGDLPWTQPHRLLVWSHRHGTLLVTLGLVREMLFWIGCYLVAVWSLMLVAGWWPTSPLLRVLGHARLPGARLALRAGLGLAAVGSALTAGAKPGYAVSDGGMPGPASTTPKAGANTAPVLRYVGPHPSSEALNTPPHLSAPGPQGPGPPRFELRPGTTSPPGPPGFESPPGTTSPPGPGLASPRRGAPRATSSSEAAPVTPLPASPGTTSPFGPAPARAASRPPRPSRPSRPPARTQPGVDRRRPDTWFVRPGDNLWSIAEATLTGAWGHPPALRDLAPYWWQVVQLNRPNLPEPADPNLLLPGDRVTLPPPPVAPAPD